MVIADRECPVNATPAALSALRPLHSLVLDFGYRRSLQNIPVILKPLERYARLTALHISLTNAFSKQLGTPAHTKAQAVPNTALTAISDNNQSLTSLALLCSARSNLRLPCDGVRPTHDALRSLCSFVRQLSLAPDDLVLLSWGDDARRSRVWKTLSVRSFVITRSISHEYFSQEHVVAALRASLPSLTHLHVRCLHEAGGMDKALRWLGDRLAFLRCATSALHQPHVVFAACTGLTSLYLTVDQPTWKMEWHKDKQLDRLLTALSDCGTLEELTVVVEWGPWSGGTFWQQRFKQVAGLAALPRRYLHIRSAVAIDVDQLCASLAPGLSHLVLSLSPPDAVALPESFSSHLLPHLTHCHIGFVTRTPEPPPSSSELRRWASGQTMGERPDVAEGAAGCRMV